MLISLAAGIEGNVSQLQFASKIKKTRTLIN